MSNIYKADLPKLAPLMNFLFGRSTSRSNIIPQFCLQRHGCLNGERPFLALKRRRPETRKLVKSLIFYNKECSQGAFCIKKKRNKKPPGPL